MANARTVQGSFRQFIQNANALVGIQSTNFEFAAPLVGGAHTITLTSALPAIHGNIVIDGTTDAAFAGTPVVELNGAGAGAFSHGLYVDGGNTTIRGLVVNRFTGDGIQLTRGPCRDRTT